MQDLDDMNIEIMRNTLYKAYLEDFYNFCKVGTMSDTPVFFGMVQCWLPNCPACSNTEAGRCNCRNHV